MSLFAPLNVCTTQMDKKYLYDCFTQVVRVCVCVTIISHVSNNRNRKWNVQEGQTVDQGWLVGFSGSKLFAGYLFFFFGSSSVATITYCWWGAFALDVFPVQQGNPRTQSAFILHKRDVLHQEHFTWGTWFDVINIWDVLLRYIFFAIKV